MTSSITKKYREQQAATSAKYFADLDAVRSNPTLSDTGKAQHLADAYLRARAEHDDIEQRRINERTTRRDYIFSNWVNNRGGADPAAVTAMRDAEDRADQLKDEQDALRMLERAERMNDQYLARAALTKAYDHGWAEVVNAYTAAHPAAYDSLEELWDITQEEAAESGRIISADLLQHHLATPALKKPTEIVALNDSRLEALPPATPAR
ncbi:hypothetical protein [Curtobacterium sp. L1-20]|uniref:hypothetical protein n=1 Tax=Curtobacterium sp. L1-20 TaxID=3138181 RepID=UPI003B522E92